jgi:hypothetical protein
MKDTKKYSFRQQLKNLPKKDIPEYLHDQVFKTSEFDLHIKRVAFNLKVDESIVRDVVISYFTNVMIAINTARKIKTKINIYGFFSLIIEKGNRF